MAGFYDNLEASIAKYGGSDEAYKLKLKNTIRETLGYSNYRSQASSAMKKPLDLSLMKGNITPAGVKSLVGGAVNMQEQEAGTYQGMANKVDTAAGQIATDQISKARAAASARQNAMGLENGVVFQPKDQLDIDILGYMQNPRNPDGSVKSLQQFEAEQDEKYGTKKTSELDANITRMYQPDYVNSRIQQRIPKDFLGNEDKYFLMAQGYSAKQAEENAGALRFNKMSPEEQLAWSTAHPAMAKILSATGNDPALIADAGIKVDENGKEVPKYSFQELQEKYSGVDPKIIAAAVKPAYTTLMKQDIKQNVNFSLIEEAKKNNNLTPQVFAELLDDDEYKKFKKAILPMYGGVLTDDEIDQIVFNLSMQI